MAKANNSELLTKNLRKEDRKKDFLGLGMA